MLFHSECRWLKSIHGVTAGAFNATGALDELAAMRIGAVTIGAVRVRQRLLEIRAAVTLNATDSSVFSQQRVCRF